MLIVHVRPMSAPDRRQSRCHVRKGSPVGWMPILMLVSCLAGCTVVAYQPELPLSIRP